MGKNATFRIRVKGDHRYSPRCTEHVFSVIALSLPRLGLDHTNCDKSRIATARIPVLLRIVTVAIFDGSNTTSQIDFNSTRGYTPNYRKHVHIEIGPFQWGLLGTSFMALWLTTDIHTNRYTSEITPKWAKKQLFVFVSKVIMGTLESTKNTFPVLLDSVCHVWALITYCDKSQIATAGIPDLSQFVTSQFVTVQYQ